MRLVLHTCGALLVSAALLAESSYVPHRVFSAVSKQFSDFETMVADVARADLVFVGEEHNDRNTHRLELALLEALARRRSEIVVAMEMFERDAQEPIEHFVMGHTDEADFIRDARAWPQYASDYKPLVDFAIAKHWPVVAANAPRPLVAEVSASGLGVLKAKTEAEKALVAQEIRCPLGDAYFKRFEQAMGAHSTQPAAAVSSTPLAPSLAGPPGASGAMERYYQAQCVKDETMGESIAQAFTAGAVGGKRPLVVMFNGAFHSDYGQGTVQRTRRRLPDKRAVVISIVPVDNLDSLTPNADAKRADYLVYTIGNTKGDTRAAQP